MAGDAGLARRIRARVVLALLVQHCPSLALLFIVPALVGVLGGAPMLSLRTAPALVFLALLWLGGRKAALPDDLRTHEALSTTALIFLIAAAGMTWPLMGHGLGPVEALYEAMSGLTSNGSTMVRDIQAWPWPALVARAWTQWYGGFVILTVVVALVVHPGTTARRLGLLSVKSDDMVDMIRGRARKVLLAYAGVTLLCILAIYATLGNLLAAVTLGFATVSTGGYSIYNDGVSSLPVPALVAIAAFCLIGASPLDSISRVPRDGVRAFFGNAEVRALLALAAGGWLALLVLQWAGAGLPSLAEAGRLGFITVSAQTTTGFSMTGSSSLMPAQALVVMLMMAVGGALGSTAGGIKLLRFLVLKAVIRQNLRDTATGPHALTTPRVAGKKVHDDEVDHSLVTVVLFLAVHAVSIVVLAACGVPVLDAAFDVVAATSNAGLTHGIAAPDLGTLPKLVLIANMWLGRLEVLAVIVLLTPRYWLARE